MPNTHTHRRTSSIAVGDGDQYHPHRFVFVGQQGRLFGTLAPDCIQVCLLVGLVARSQACSCDSVRPWCWYHGAFRRVIVQHDNTTMWSRPERQWVGSGALMGDAPRI